MIRARFSPKAGRDLDEHCGHIAADNPEAAGRVRQIILNTADFLGQHRELGRRIRKAAPRHAQIRWFVVPKFRNYLIFYQISEMESHADHRGVAPRQVAFQSISLVAEKQFAEPPAHSHFAQPVRRFVAN